jgi:hypothetical protein
MAILNYAVSDEAEFVGLKYNLIVSFFATCPFLPSSN